MAGAFGAAGNAGSVGSGLGAIVLGRSRLQGFDGFNVPRGLIE